MSMLDVFYREKPIIISYEYFSYVRKFFELHVCWLASQAKLSNDLVPKVGALGDGFEVILQALCEVLLGPFVYFILAGTKVPFCDSHTLKAASKKILLLVHLLRFIFNPFPIAPGVSF